jgi:hypothetical protein
MMEIVISDRNLMQLYNMVWISQPPDWLWLPSEECREKSNKHFKDTYCASSSQTKSNMTGVSAVINSWVSLTKYQTQTFIMNSTD